MSDAAPIDRQARTTRGGVLAGVWTAVALFLALLALLATRMADGQDPALRTHVASTLPARQVLIRRVLELRVIVHLPSSAPLRPTQAAQHISPAGGPLLSPLVTRTS